MSDDTVSWFAAVDWGSAQHQACILDAAGKTKGERAFPHGGTGLAALCDWLVSVAGDPGMVAVAIEVPHGPVVDALLDRGFAVHAISHRQLVGPRSRWRVIGTVCPWLRRSGDAGDLGPNLKGLGPGGSILGGGYLVAAEAEEVVDPIMGGEETLRLAG